MSFIFTKQPTRARFLLKNAQAHVFFQTESLAWTDAKLNFARSRPDEIRQILETFLQFLQSPLASIRLHGSLNRPCFIKVERIVDYSLPFPADLSNFNNWNPKN